MAALSATGTANSAPGTIVPAQLGFLAIFNPTLGNTDETIEDQIVYYASVTTQASHNKRRRTRSQPTKNISPEERNERLRQIGLAQGMASFSRGFASGSTVDTIDTEKSRVILHELEPGWWILASIDLTKLPLPPRLATKKSEAAEERYEYSSREMKPASLMLRDLLRAHSIFLMHHDSSLSALFVRNKRTKFITILSRYWDLYLSTWNVMMHGNPARDIFGGIPIAASGELGVGVGEEDRGSGERAVLEGLVGRIEGLVDLVASKFGDYNPDSPPPNDPYGDPEQWLGTGREPGPDDGAIFLGTGALSRKSLRDVTHWMEDLYTWGDHAYGVIESPTSVRRAKRRRAADRTSHQAAQDQTQTQTTAASKPAKASTEEQAAGTSSKDQPQLQVIEDGRLDKMVSYLKLGYGTYWSLPGGTGSGDSSNKQPESPQQDSKPTQDSSKLTRPNFTERTPSYEAVGHYLIGLKGEINEDYSGSDSASSDDAGDGEHNSRTVLRTVNIELESEALDRPEAITLRDFEHPASALSQSQVVGNMIPGYDSHDLNKAKKLRVVVYVNRPFMFTLLFNLRTDSLAMDSLYRSLHHQLAPLRKPLLLSTKYRPERPGTDAGCGSNNSENSIYDLVWDPVSLTVHSTIPNIPEVYDDTEPWSRPDALNTHLHLVNLYIGTRSRSTALERTEKSGRGWWIVWTRLLDRQEDSVTGNLSTIHEAGAGTDRDENTTLDEEERKYSGPDPRHPDVAKEIFLIRRASDHVGFRTDPTDGAGKLAQGIGVDTRRYVEELLNLL
ncbi:Vacuolar fusion protein CCZ1 like protein [Fusarium austroafricanum]|uniref:Vacuolar fusion protein CCZ1 like protein n=1 Tax=Fusarium austroafricanum TaxID=2364996 RepID=A0A8H4KBP1_9HYPO|nr:Vacuolar fusion protein CCZ1 like protein [Fusarium austroafricanum]